MCKRHLRIYLHGLGVGPTQTDLKWMPTLRFLMQQFACSPQVLAPEKSPCTTTELLVWTESSQTTDLIHPSIHPLLSSPARMSSLDLNFKVALCTIQLESRVMIQGKLTQVTWEKQELLQEKSPIVWSTAIFHLYCLSPITEQNTCPVFANPPLQVLNQSKASTASEQLSNFKIHLLSSSQTLDLCPKGTILYITCCLVWSPTDSI